MTSLDLEKSENVYFMGTILKRAILTTFLVVSGSRKIYVFLSVYESGIVFMFVFHTYANMGDRLTFSSREVPDLMAGVEQFSSGVSFDNKLNKLSLAHSELRKAQLTSV